MTLTVRANEWTSAASRPNLRCQLSSAATRVWSSLPPVCPLAASEHPRPSVSYHMHELFCHGKVTAVSNSEKKINLTNARKELLPSLRRDESIHAKNCVATHVLQLGQLRAAGDCMVVQSGHELLEVYPYSITIANCQSLVYYSQTCA